MPNIFTDLLCPHNPLIVFDFNEMISRKKNASVLEAFVLWSFIVKFSKQLILWSILCNLIVLSSFLDVLF